MKDGKAKYSRCRFKAWGQETNCDSSICTRILLNQNTDTNIQNWLQKQISANFTTEISKINFKLMTLKPDHQNRKQPMMNASKTTNPFKSDQKATKTTTLMSQSKSSTTILRNMKRQLKARNRRRKPKHQVDHHLSTPSKPYHFYFHLFFYSFCLYYYQILI